MNTVMIELTQTVSLAFEVLAGMWGNNEERRTRLTEAGYNYNEVQSCVNDLVKLMKRYSS